MHTFAYVRPRSLSEAFGLLDSHGSDAKVLAGGTDLVVGLQHGRFHPEVVVDLKRIGDLPPGVRSEGDRLVIAAPTTLSELVADPDVRRSFPALVEAAGMVGSTQIRNRATLAGNVCNASPAGDTLPALLVYGAEVVLASRAGTRRTPLDRFLLGPGQTALRSGELLVAIELPVPEQPLGARFLRLTRRRGVDLATVSVCCAVGSHTTRLGLGAVGPTAFAVSDSTGLLADRTANDRERDALLDRLVSAASPISDVRGGRDYRRAMVSVLSRRALLAALACRDEG